MIKRTAIFASLVFLAILAGAYRVDQIVVKEQHDRARAEVLSQVSVIKAKLERGLNNRLFLEKGVKAFILTHLAIDPTHDISQAEVDEFGRNFMPQLLGIRNITLIQNSVITHVYPLAGNEQAIGVDLASIPSQREAVQRVAETRESLLAGPVQLVQGGTGIINRSPIYWLPPGETVLRYWGQTSLVFMQEDLFIEAGLYEHPELLLAMRGKDGNGSAGDLFWGEAEAFTADPVLVGVKINNSMWQLAAAPRMGWYKAQTLNLWIWLVGLAMAASCSALVWFLGRSKDAEAQLRRISFHDPVTDLYNRTYFEKELQRIAHGQPDAMIGIAICDLDGLKLTNDILGHEVGDYLLITAASMLKECFGRQGMVARIGGDEFAVLFEQADSECYHTGQQQLETVIQAYNARTPLVPLSLSIGYSFGRTQDISLLDLSKQADDNMYWEKMQHSQQSRQAIVQAILRMASAREFHDSQYIEHLVLLFAQKIDFPAAKWPDLCLLAKYHDIGLVGIPETILHKPGKLTQEEVMILRRHCEIGHRIALASSELAHIADWILKHQEWWDGHGYPLGLAGENIPLPCRMFAIIDAYEAMTHDRPYRQAISAAAACAELRRCSGSQFDPQLVEIFCAEVLLEKSV